VVLAVNVIGEVFAAQLISEFETATLGGPRNGSCHELPL
jgi:hypothetical protein